MTEQEYDRMFRDYFPALCLFAFNIIKDVGRAEDMVQDTFVGMWHRRELLGKVVDLRPYLYTAVRYKCIDYLRSLKRPAPADPGYDLAEQSFEHQMIAAETARQLHQAIKALPKRMQEVTRLYYLEGRSYSDIARILGTDPETVRNQRNKAIAWLRKLNWRWVVMLLVMRGN